MLLRDGLSNELDRRCLSGVSKRAEWNRATILFLEDIFDGWKDIR